MYHRKRNAYGLQFCPTCLAEDSVPYFRRRWRVAFYTVCNEHKTMLLDRCPKCGSSVAAHRLDIGCLAG
ncbi:TniQ family protein, partial [Undibacterium sp. CCC2.1]|uniref:TniQ family protein n=1 Tax=Undibacterium sp. CCC2.1 TaxID=3048604 RepID=UPI0034DCEC04